MRYFNLIWLLIFSARLAFAQSVFPVRDPGETRNRSYHVIHYKIDVAFDEQKKSVQGTVGITLIPFLSECTMLDFDAEKMQIASVKLGNNYPLRFEVYPKTLTVHLDRTYSFTDTLTVTIAYSCTPKKGLYFVQPDSSNPDKPSQIWTQGEDMDNHFWFPCYDFPNDRATSEVVATVRSSYVLVSNGRLVSVKEDKKRGTKTFHWMESKPHSSYLIMIAAGEYAVLRENVGNLPLEYYVYPSQTEDARICFRQTPDMIKFFNQTIGFPYAWEKYAQVLIRDFIEGGMENTSATSLMDEATVYDARVRVDESPVSLIAHELAHQWWGDVVTCKDWRHLWLNESFASYFDPLYQEHLLGKEEFGYTMFGAQRAGIDVDRRLGRKPIVSVGSYGENIYPRGAAVLHMLRFVLGDRLFFHALNHYITKYQFTNVETNDLKNAIEEATGQNLYWFFDEWIYKAGYPVFDVAYTWNDSSRAVHLSVKQTQHTDSLTGEFHMPVDIELTSPRGSATHRFNILSKDTTFSVAAPEKPLLVIFDKGNWLIKDLKFRKSAEEWRYQAEHATDPVDRVRAVQEIPKHFNELDIVPILSGIARHDSFWAVRREAVLTLGKIDTTNDAVKQQIKTVLISVGEDQKPTVRVAAMSQLGKYRGDDVIAALHAALRDSSYDVMANALSSLARADSTHAAATLTAYLQTPSYRNKIGNAVLRGLSRVDSAAALSAALTKIHAGEHLYTRYTALGVLTRYGKGREDIVSTLASLVNDRSTSFRSAVIRALGDLGNETVLPALDKIAADPDNAAAETAKQSVEKIRKRYMEAKVPAH